MSIDGQVSSGTEFELAIQEESALGTPETTAASFQRLHQPENAEYDLSGLTDDDTPRMQGQRVPQNTDRFFTKAGGVVLQPFNAIATKLTLDFFLYGNMQDIESEGVSTPFAKIFTWNRDTTQPLFTDNTGKFFTVVGKNPLASEDLIMTSAIIPTLNLSSDPGTNGGRLTMSGNIMSGFTSSGKFDESGSQSITGATEPGTDFFHHCKMVTKQLGGVDLIVASYNIALNSKGVRQGCDVNGDAQTYALGVGNYEATGTIRCLYDNNTKGVITNFMTSAFDTQLVLAYGSGNAPVDTDGDLMFQMNVGVAQPVRDFAAAEGTMIDIPFVCRDDGTNDMIEAQIANAQDRAWTA